MEAVKQEHTEALNMYYVNRDIGPPRDPPKAPLIVESIDIPPLPS